MAPHANITRRAALSALGATTTAVGLGIVPALASTAHLDAVLLSLEPSILQAQRRWYAVLDRQSAAEGACFEAKKKARATAGELDEGLREAAETAKAASDLAFAPYGALLEQVASTPARTIEGLLFKARMSILDDEGASADPSIAYSLVDDVVAVLGGSSATASLGEG